MMSTQQTVREGRTEWPACLIPMPAKWCSHGLLTGNLDGRMRPGCMHACLRAWGTYMGGSAASVLMRASGQASRLAGKGEVPTRTCEPEGQRCSTQLSKSRRCERAQASFLCAILERSRRSAVTLPARVCVRERVRVGVWLCMFACACDEGGLPLALSLIRPPKSTLPTDLSYVAPRLQLTQSFNLACPLAHKQMGVVAGGSRSFACVSTASSPEWASQDTVVFNEHTKESMLCIGRPSFSKYLKW